MLFFRSKSFLLFSTFFVIFSNILTFSGGVHQSHLQQSIIPITGVLGEEKNGGLVSRRHLVDETNAELLGNSSFILAEKRTYRKDPLDGFNRYTGGWNISNRHYWASVGYTGAPLFLIGVIWFICFGLCLSLICLYYCCCSRRPYGYSRTAYALSLILLTLFTISAIVGCVVLYTGQGKFHSITTNTLDYVVRQANTTVNKLRKVSDYLSAAKQIGVAKVFLGNDIQTKIDEIETKINSSATTLATKTEDNSNDIQDVLDNVRLALIVLAAVMMLLAFLGFLFSVLGMQFFVYVLVIVGWFLVAGTFILCGIFLFLHNVVGDTCVSMNQWVQHPTAHTALDDILPCVDNATATETLLRSKEVTSQLVNVVNQVVTNFSNINFSPNFKPFYYNQSGPLLPLLCNPFYPDMTDRNCANGEVDLKNATQVWRNYICQVSADGICTTVGRLTPDFYNQMTAAVNVSYGLYHYGPFLVQLEDCTFVRETFTEIHSGYCPSLRQYSRWIYIGLVMVSAAVMLSLIFWVIYARERRHRVYTKRFNKSAQGHFEEKGP